MLLRQQIKNVSSLLTTMGLIGLCVGMTSTLLSIRGALEDFSTLTIGLIMSAYYVGYLFGSTRAAKDIRRVGYIRAFGGLGAIGAVMVLIQAIWIDPTVWLITRFISGFAFSAMFVIAESWLNTVADNKSRGSMLAIYLVLLYGGLIVGQLLLGFTDPTTLVPFVLVAMMINLALIPILASVTIEPTTHEVRKVPARLLIKKAPLGLTGTFMAQACSAMFYGVGPVYAAEIGLDVLQITFFMASYLTGGMLAQAPVGYLSDKYDRRLVLSGAAVLAAIIASLLTFVSDSYPILLYIGMALLGACVLPIYALGIAHTNDYLEKEEMLGATGTIIKVSGVGAILGAPAVAALMQFGEPYYFFTLMASLMLFVSLYAGHQVLSRRKPKTQQVTPLTTVAATHVNVTESFLQTMVESADSLQADGENAPNPLEEHTVLEEPSMPEVKGPPVKK